MVIISCGQKKTVVKKKPAFKYKISSPLFTSPGATNNYTIKEGCIYFNDYDRDTTVIGGNFMVTKNN